MKEEKDSFGRMVEDNLRNYEVPYNESHWNEMSSILDKYSMPSGTTTSPVRWIAGSGIAAIAILGLWYLVSKQEAAQIQADTQTGPPPGVIAEQKETASGPDIEERASDGENARISATGATAGSENEKQSPEVKIDKYASYSEGQVKEKGRQFVDNEIEKQATSFKNEPKIDNKDLATAIIVSEGVICQGEAIQFKVSREISGATYYWNFGDKGLSIRIVEAFVPIGLAGIVFLIAAKILRINELEQIYGTLKRKLAR